MASESLCRTILEREWFYPFLLPNGEETRSYLPDRALPIHVSRRQMLFDFLDQAFASRWAEVRGLDLGCHEGYFSIELARRGCREVLGIDGRREHVEHADLLRRVFELDNLRFERAEIGGLDSTSLGRFDVTLMLGLLYHLPDVIGALRLAREVTAGVCLLETQVAPELEGDLEWGSVDFRKDIVGCFAIVDEQAELETGNREASLSRISLVPSLRGLHFLLHAVGFARVETLEPPADTYEQLARGKRVIVAAWS